MKYVFTVTLSSSRGLETKDVEFVGLPEKDYEFTPINCIPNDSKVISVSANHGNVIWYEEEPVDPNVCCAATDPIVKIPPPPGPTPVPQYLPRAPYDLSIASGSVVFAWFHNNAPPEQAQYFDIYRSHDGIDFTHIKTIYARGNSIRVYNIIDTDYECGGTLFYRVAARNELGTVYAEETSQIVVETCTPTPTPTPTDNLSEYSPCYPTPTPTPTPTASPSPTPSPTPTPTSYFQGNWTQRHYEYRDTVCWVDKIWSARPIYGTDPDDEPGSSLHWQYLSDTTCPTPTPTPTPTVTPTPTPSPTPTVTPTPTPTPTVTPTPTPTPTPTDP